MSKFQNKRDGILDANDRRNSALKCISLINAAGGATPMRTNDGQFFRRQADLAAKNRTSYSPSEAELAWLRDLVERYVTR